MEEIIERNQISISEEERKLLSDFVGENLQWAYVDWNRLMPVVEKIEQITLKEVIGVAASKPYWENEKLTVSIGSTVSPKEFAAKQANDFPVCFTINGKKAWIQYYFTSIHGGDGHFEMREANTTSKIESAWKVVVDFIKFYNSNKS